MSVDTVARPDEYQFRFRTVDGSAKRTLASYNRDDVGPQVFGDLFDTGCTDVIYERTAHRIGLSVAESCMFDHRKAFTFDVLVYSEHDPPYIDGLANNPGESVPVVGSSPGEPLPYSSESPEGTIYRLYRAYFLREPDSSGFNHWLQAYKAGYSLIGISNDFARSSEFQQRYGSVDDRAFVDRVYRNVLGRAPEAGGYDYWVDQLGRGMIRGELMIYFSDSAEFRTRTKDGRPPGYA